MDDLFEPADASLFTCTLEILSADDTEPDPAAVHTLGSEMWMAMQQDGTIVTPIASEGQRGGPGLVFQIVWQGVQAAGTMVMVQKDSLDVLAALCTIFATISPLVTRLFHTDKQQKGLKVSIWVDQASIEITSTDVTDDERIVQIAQRFLVQHPIAQVSKKSKVKVQARVSSSRPRRRR